MVRVEPHFIVPYLDGPPSAHTGAPRMFGTRPKPVELPDLRCPSSVVAANVIC